MKDTTHETSQLDALGNPIIIGNKYGYSISSSGVTTTVVGIAKNFTTKGVTLTVESALSAVYSYAPKKVKYESKIVTVKCLICFPVK